MDVLYRKTLKRKSKGTRPPLVRNMSLLLRTDEEIEYAQQLKRFRGKED